MKDLIFLFTPQHTGTHFVRMILESHPLISTAIGEDFHVQTNMDSKFLLKGKGFGAVSPEGEAAGTIKLVEIARSYLHGEMSKTKFVQYLIHRQKLVSEQRDPVDNYRWEMNKTIREFAAEGLVLDHKRRGETHLLYRGHCNDKHYNNTLQSAYDEIKVVTTIRHPLLSFITFMRRQSPEKISSLTASYLAGMNFLMSVNNKFVFCTDLWQNQPDKMLDVFGYIGIEPPSVAKAFVAKQPLINETTSHLTKPHSKHNFCPENKAHTESFLEELRKAKQMLIEEGKIHSILEPYWKQVRESGILNKYEAYGYVF